MKDSYLYRLTRNIYITEFSKWVVLPWEWLGPRDRASIGRFTCHFGQLDQRLCQANSEDTRHTSRLFKIAFRSIDIL